MFEKLVALLPFNPSLAHDLAFYGRRMREEASIRRTGMVFIVLTFFVQFFAVLVPPQPTVADSSNDLINNGISSAADAKSKCDNNTQNYKDIMANYGITCADLGSASTVDSLKSTDEGGNLFSFGRLPQGAKNVHSGKTTDETPVNIPNLGTIYARRLASFDTGAYSPYKALKFKASLTGKTYYVLYSCGNLVSIGVPVPAPSFTVVKGVGPKGGDGPYYKDFTSKPGAVVNFSVELRNTGSSTLDSVYFKDVLPAGLTAVPGSLKVDNTPTVGLLAGFNTGSLAAGQFKRVTFQATIGSTVNTCGSNPLVNTVTITADKLPAQQSSASVTACKTTPPPSTPPPAIPPSVPEACMFNSSLPKDSPDCKPCAEALSSQNAIACVSVSKAASNTTRGYADANDTTAQASDVIVYTLFAKNGGKAKVSGFVFQENISDVLDYATVTDYHGGVLNTGNTIVWPSVDIAPGETVSKQVTVKVKDVIPQTPTSSSDSTHFDLNMANVYGNAINIKLPGSPAKTIETVATTLPNTGPGTSMVLAGAVFLLAGYFYSRSRLLATEVDIELQETTAGGI